MNLQVNLNYEKFFPGQTAEELAQRFKVGFLLLAYLKAEISLGEFAELMNLEYVEARNWLIQLGIPTMRQKPPELEKFMQENLHKFMQRHNLQSVVN